jgi:hypothetical protein
MPLPTCSVRALPEYHYPLCRLKAEAVLWNETQTVLPPRVTRNTTSQNALAAVTRPPSASGNHRPPLPMICAARCMISGLKTEAATALHRRQTKPPPAHRPAEEGRKQGGNTVASVPGMDIPRNFE